MPSAHKRWRVTGTVSEIGGGKFSNGALSGAFTFAIASQDASRKAPKDAVTDAKLAKDVNRKKPIGTGNFIVKAADQLKSGLKWALYSNGTTNVLAFAGTNPLSWADWKANFLQAFGFQSAQYEQGIDLAVDLFKANNGNLRFAGHSLGGGIATAASIITGGHASTFNPAGVHDSTLRGFSAHNANVHVYSSSFDLLGVGNLITPASVRGNHIPLGVAGLHGLGGVCADIGC